MPGRRTPLALLLLLACGGSGVDEEARAPGPEREDCARLPDPVSQIGCYGDWATREGDVAICDGASHEGVRFQCYAIVAERRDDPGLCRRIPPLSPDHIVLRDLCLSDIAERRADPGLCEEVQTQGVRDSCYLKISEATGDRSLCDEIEDPGLKSGCAS